MGEIGPGGFVLAPSNSTLLASSKMPLQPTFSSFLPSILLWTSAPSRKYNLFMPPRWALRLGPSLRLLITFPLPILLLSWLFIGTSFGTVIGTKHLYCMTCIRVESDTTALDQFRVRQALTMPMCEMEPVECEPHQDTCVTISMQITHRQFWMGSGCDQRVNYDFPSGGRDGCVEMPAIYRNFHPGFMEERRTLQRVCLCSGNLCNSAVGLHPKCPPLHFPLLLTAIVSALITFWPRLLLLLPMEL